MKKILFSLFALSLFAAVTPAQAQMNRYVREWRNLNGPQITNTSTCNRDDLNFVATTIHRPGGFSYINVTCFNPDGSKLWNKTYEEPGIQNSFAGKIMAGPQGLMLVGSVGAYNGDNEVILMMLDYGSGGIMDQVKYHPSGINAPAMYGFDVAYDYSDNTFILVGTGAYSTSNVITNPRFAWSMKVDANPGNMNTVYWDNYFEVIPGNSWYDSFNNIEIVDGPSGMQYHLSGSASTPLPGGQQFTTVNSVLLNQDGTVAWSAPFTNYNTLPANNLWGCDALYKQPDANFPNGAIFMLYFTQNVQEPVVVPLDLSTGAGLTPERHLAPFSYIGGTIPYNMSWTDPAAQDKITFSGINTIMGQTFMCSADPITGAPDWMYTYPGTFDPADLNGINYDLVTRPMDGSNDRVFFAPNALSPNYNDNINYLSSIANVSGQEFNHLAIKTIGDGTHPLSGCAMGIAWDAPQGNNITNMASLDAPMHMQAQPLILAEQDVDEVFFDHCPAMKPGRTTGMETVAKTQNGLKLYPNPAAEYCTLEWTATAVTRVLVSDVTGRLVQQTEAPAGNTLAIDTREWSKGTYHVSVQTEKGTQHLSFVKL